MINRWKCYMCGRPVTLKTCWLRPIDGGQVLKLCDTCRHIKV